MVIMMVIMMVMMMVTMMVIMELNIGIRAEKLLVKIGFQDRFDIEPRASAGYRKDVPGCPRGAPG